MAGLFGKSKKTISEYTRNIFSEGELDEQVVVRKFRTITRHRAMPEKNQSKEIIEYPPLPTPKIPWSNRPLPSIWNVSLAGSRCTPITKKTLGQAMSGIDMKRWVDVVRKHSRDSGGKYI